MKPNTEIHTYVHTYNVFVFAFAAYVIKTFDIKHLYLYISI